MTIANKQLISTLMYQYLVSVLFVFNATFNNNPVLFYFKNIIPEIGENAHDNRAFSPESANDITEQRNNSSISNNIT
jgi:hypothetical protein